MTTEISDYMNNPVPLTLIPDDPVPHIPVVVVVDTED
jgi:hypothetical protein